MQTKHHRLPCDQQHDPGGHPCVLPDHRIDLDLPLLRSNTDTTEITLTARYQGCADRGICYPPQKQVFKLGLPAAAGAATTCSVGAVGAGPSMVCVATT